MDLLCTLFLTLFISGDKCFSIPFLFFIFVTYHFLVYRLLDVDKAVEK